MVVLEPLDQPVDDGVVPVVTAEVGISRGGLHLEDTVADLEDRHIEGPTTEVEDQDGVIGLLVETVGQGRRRGLVDDPEHIETRDLSGLLGGLTLGVVEIGRDGDDCVGHRVAQIQKLLGEG